MRENNIRRFISYIKCENSDDDELRDDEFLPWRWLLMKQKRRKIRKTTKDRLQNTEDTTYRRLLLILVVCRKKPYQAITLVFPCLQFAQSNFRAAQCA